jgi:long-chain acyl-CoA synthetase
MLIWNRLKAQAASQGEKLAVVCGDTRLTYSQFVTQVENVALTWLQQGLRPGDRIALHLRNGCDLAMCYYACFAAGFVAVPINNRLTPEEIAYVLDHSGARVYLAQPDLRIQTSIHLWDFDFGAVVGDPLAQPGLPAPNANDPSLLLYTSGTTARPKGVIHTQRTLAGNASYMDNWGLTPEDHTLLFTSMAHASGSIMLLNLLALDRRQRNHRPRIRSGHGARHLGTQRRHILYGTANAGSRSPD